MGEIRLDDIAAALRPGAGDQDLEVAIIGSAVVLDRESTGECVVSLRDGRVDICLPLFAFALEQASQIVEWALDINLRNPEPGRLALHASAPVLMFIDSLAAEDPVLLTLPKRIGEMWGSALALRDAAPLDRVIRTGRVADFDEGHIIFRA